MSRKEKRKAARREKKQHKHQSFLQHQKLRKQKRNLGDMKKAVLANNKIETREISLLESGSDGDQLPWESTVMKSCHSQHLRNGNIDYIEMSLTESDSDGDSLMAEPVVFRNLSRKDDRKASEKKTKFEEYLEMETKRSALWGEDLEMERRLAKKLKVKGGKLRNDDDGLNLFFKGIPSVLGSSDIGHGYSDSGTENVDDTDNRESKKKRRKKGKCLKQVCDSHDDVSDDKHSEGNISIEMDEEGEANTTLEKDSETENVESTENKKSKNKKRGRKKSDGEEQSEDDFCKGQVKNMSSEQGEKGEANTTMEKHQSVAKEVLAIGKYIAPHLRSQAGNNSEEHIQIRRRVRGLLNRLSESNVESITGEISMVFQSVSRAVASEIFSEEVLASCSGGPRGNEQYAAVFAAFVAGMACMVGIDFGARLMASLAQSFEDEYLKEDNLSLRNLSLLLSYLCIFGVCSSDLIYDFLIKLSKRLTEIDVSTILTVLQCCGMKLRGDDPAAMKDFILSVQTRVNELKAASGDTEANVHSKRMEFMIETICEIKNNKRRAKEDAPQHTRIKKWLQKLRVEDIIIRGIKWSKLLDPNKKGQWWFGDVSPAAEDVDKVAGKIDKEVHEAQKMLQLASKLRMNTDTRKAIFCVIMSSEDYLDAFEKLLGLNLQGKQDREIMRVLVECCLQEKVFNKYYTALASKLCSHDKNHKFTLQYCLWDQFKELESMPLLRSMHLAKFVAEMITGFTLSLAVLKVVDLIDGSQLTAKRRIHFRMLLEAIFEHPDNVVWNVFTRAAITPELEELRNGLEFFIREYVVTSNKAAGKKFKLAKKALNNAEGVLL